MTDRDAIVQRLTEAGLSATAIAHHSARLDAGEVDEADLRRYAGHLDHLAMLSGGGLNAAFWDHRSEAMQSAGVSVYAQAAAMVMTAPYVRLLANAHRRFHLLQTAPADEKDALLAALDLLRMAAGYIAADYPTQPLTDTLRGSAATAEVTPAGLAVYLWQRLVTGSTRSVRGTQPYSHGIYNHHNVVTMHHFSDGTPLDPAIAWGTSGLKARYVGDAKRNRNQIEHLAISAVLQVTLWRGWLTLPMLNWVELSQWLLQRQVNWSHARADIAVNNTARILTQLDVHASHDTVEKLIYRMKR